jgi:type I restriction enzyme S subunit
VRASRLRLYPEEFFRLRIILPPAPEQKKIVARLATETAAQNAALKQAEREIGLLREYRTRLTADVVTGRLDVCEAARNLPASLGGAPVALDDEELEEEVEV